jgi:MFS family permease
MSKKDSGEKEVVDTPNQVEISPLREVLFIMLMFGCQILTQAGVAQCMNAPSDIGADFDVLKPGQLGWFTASYSLTLGSFMIFSSGMGDRFGYKPVFIFGLVIFGMGSLACGFAVYSRSYVFFNVARGLQGVGSALSLPNAMALIVNYFPEGKKKDNYMAYFGAVTPLGFVLGAVVVGAFTQYAWWPWSFWMCGITCFVMATLSVYVIPHNIGRHSIGSFEWIGGFLSFAGLSLFKFAWSQAPNIGWSNPQSYVTLIVGVICIVGCFLQGRRTLLPVVPLSSFYGASGFVLGCIAAAWSCFGIWLYFIFRWQETVEHIGPLMRGVGMVPVILGGLVASGVWARIVAKSSVCTCIAISMICFLVGMILVATRPVGQTYWAQLFCSLLITSFGMDLSIPTGIILIASSLPKERQCLAGSLVLTFVNYSISLGIGIATTVLYYITEDMPPTIDTQVIAFRSAFYTGIGLAALGVVLAAVFYLWGRARGHSLQTFFAWFVK